MQTVCCTKPWCSPATAAAAAGKLVRFQSLPRASDRGLSSSLRYPAHCSFFCSPKKRSTPGDLEMDVHASHSGLPIRLTSLLFPSPASARAPFALVILSAPEMQCRKDALARVKGEGGRQIRFGAASSPSEIDRGGSGARKELICKRCICKVSAAAASTLLRLALTKWMAPAAAAADDDAYGTFRTRPCQSGPLNSVVYPPVKSQPKIWA